MYNGVYLPNTLKQRRQQKRQRQKNVSSSNDTKKSTNTEDDNKEEIKGKSCHYIYDHTHTVPSATTHRSNSSSTGMDLNDAECVKNEQQSQDLSATSLEDNYKDEVDVDPNTNSISKDEMRDYEEAQRERMELMENAKRISDEAVDPEMRLKYLLNQSKVFHHFLEGSVAVADKKKKAAAKGGKGSIESAKRMTEEEEDSQMLKTAQSKRLGIVRLDKQPSILAKTCKMHPYQLEGLNWMIKLHDHGINGILADEMGLGKTLHKIEILAYLRPGRGVKVPHLIFVPKSCVGNCANEFKKWCPSIRAIKMLGNKSDRERVVEEYLPLDTSGKRRFDALVCSYEGLLRERTSFAKIPWHYLIIDEAHRIKNENSLLSKVVRLMTTRFGILITGTPLQNNLHEIWALQNFLLPDIFGDAEHFD